MPPSVENWLNKTYRWFLLHPYWTLTLAVLAALGPFLAKPFNVDDPLFIWTAHQIQAHPGNPYGFNVNWYGIMAPMWDVTKNPPLASYYLALAAGIFGWSEIALHFAFLLPAVAAIIGVYQLARRFCDHPMLAALVTLFTPVFLISGTTVMCDVPMLAFWVWAVVLWVDGIKQNSPGRLAAAALLIALAALTKYFGLCLIPLLAAYSLINQRRLGRWTVYLLIPLAVFGVYQLVTWMLYGHGLISLAAGTRVPGAHQFSRMATGLTALTFTGGCLAGVFFFAPLFWRRRMWTVCLAGAILLACVCFWHGAWLEKYSWIPDSSRAFVEIQVVFWAIGGIGVLALAVADVWRGRNAHAWLLALWVFGTFLFTALFNWTVNGRSLLPMAPAVGILLARHLEQKVLAERKAWTRGVVICLIAGAAFALLATRADFFLATAVRRSAQQVCAKYGRESRVLWFQGHWGFQYYMNAFGASALDLEHSEINAGDYMASPMNNVFVVPPDPQKVKATMLDVFAIPGPYLLATLNETIGANFYASILGPLPFAFGHVPPERVFVVALKPISP